MYNVVRGMFKKIFGLWREMNCHYADWIRFGELASQSNLPSEEYEDLRWKEDSALRAYEDARQDYEVACDMMAIVAGAEKLQEVIDFLWLYW